MTEDQLLTLIVPLGLKDSVIDCLFLQPYISGFNHSEIAGHSRNHGAFNIEEQVAGSRLMIRFEVLHFSGDQDALLSALGQVCALTEARYWIVSVIEPGHTPGS